MAAVFCVLIFVCALAIAWVQLRELCREVRRGRELRRREREMWDHYIEQRRSGVIGERDLTLWGRRI